MVSKRDAHYYKERLRRDHPGIYRALQAGMYPSVRQAAAAAGLTRLPTPLDALKREWKKASGADRAAFLRWLKGYAVTTSRTLRPIVDAAGYLTPAAESFLQAWMTGRGRNVRPGKIMKEIGFSNYDYRLAQVIKRSIRLPSDISLALEPWMRRQGFK